MSIRPHPTVALALATALAGAAPGSVGAVAAEEVVAEHCYTEALTAEEVEAGAYSEIVCYPADEEPPAARRMAVSFATVYTGANGSGTPLTIGGASCTGGAANFAPGSAWDNVISSTDLLACGNAKHWSGNGFTGSNQLVSGGGIHNMNGTLNNATSSIQYAP